MAKHTPMDDEAADRISRAAWVNPNSDTAQSGWDERARDAARNNDPYDDYFVRDDEDDEDA